MSPWFVSIMIKVLPLASVVLRGSVLFSCPMVMGNSVERRNTSKIMAGSVFLRMVPLFMISIHLLYDVLYYYMLLLNIKVCFKS